MPHDPWESVYNIYSQEEYLLDSGAMCHVTNSSEYLEDRMIDNTQVKVGNNSSCKVNMSGRLSLKIENTDGIEVIILD